MRGTVFHQWQYHVDTPERSVVFPDGCRDLLVIRRPDEPDHIRMTEFDLHPRAVALAEGTAITGFRLRPGAVLSDHILRAIAANPDAAGGILANELSDSSEMDEAIHALTLPEASVDSVARDLGVSIRTMQRRFQHWSLPPPEYWRLLSRVRHAAGLLLPAAQLADVACQCGYSDQAHMTREFTRWFGATPAEARRNAGLLDLLRQPALGNWTDEQSSTR